MSRYKSLFFIAIMLFSMSTTFAQKIHKNDVPSLVMNNFHQQFSRVNDVEWKMDQNVYKVEFEVGIRNYDHTVWYSRDGEMLSHKAEISKRDLPQSITNVLNTDFKGYRVDDVKMISKGNDITYTMELKRFDEEWKVSFSPNGRVLNKIPD